jgi:hypothetical protein
VVLLNSSKVHFGKRQLYVCECTTFVALIFQIKFDYLQHLRLELARVADLASSPSVAVPPIVSQPLVVAAIPFDFKSNRESNVADVPSVNSTAPKSSGLSSSISFELRQLRADLDESMSKFADERRQQHQSLCQLGSASFGSFQ